MYLFKYIGLGVVFFICFALVVFLGTNTNLKTLLAKEKLTILTQHQDLEIKSTQNFLKIANSTRINPHPNQDFLITSWVQFKRLPKPNKSITFLSKTSNRKNGRTFGYSISLVKDGQRYRPKVLWKDKRGKGHYVLFSDIELKIKDWLFLALVLQDNTKIGLYACVSASLELADCQLSLLGGDNLRKPIIASTDTALYIGAAQENQFKGTIGPVGIYSGQNISQNLVKKLKYYLKDPKNPIQQISSEDRMFFSVAE